MSARRERDQWSEQQVILAMDLYRTLGREPDDTEPEVLELSRLIGRKPSAVTFKIGNLRSIETRGEHGFKHAGTTDRKVWEKFENNVVRLHNLALAIKKRFASTVPVGWVFKADAALGWLASKKARPGKTDYWEKVQASEVQAWSPVLIMQCGTSKPGFYARGTVLPSERSSKARVRYDEVFADPLLFDAASPESAAGRTWDDGRLPYLLGLKSPKGQKAAPCRMVGTHFPVSERDAESLAQIFPGLRWLYTDSTPEEEPVSELERTGRGQGFFTGSSAKRKKIEEIAMRRARQHFEHEKYKVQDFHATRPYDLKCTKEGETVYVEVKGTTTDGDRVLVTPGEVKFALKNASKMALFVVSSLELTSKGAERSGNIHIEKPWRLDERNLTPTGYFLELEFGTACYDSPRNKKPCAFNPGPRTGK